MLAAGAARFPDREAIVATDTRLTYAGLHAGACRVARALLSLGARELAPELVDETLGVVLKYEEDIRRIRGATSRRYLSEAGASA